MRSREQHFLPLLLILPFVHIVLLRCSFDTINLVKDHSPVNPNTMQKNKRTPARKRTLLFASLKIT
jgi:hypothetical protein